MVLEMLIPNDGFEEFCKTEHDRACEVYWNGIAMGAGSLEACKAFVRYRLSLGAGFEDICIIDIYTGEVLWDI